MHFVLLGSLLFNVYLIDSFYGPVDIGGPPIPGAMSMQSCLSEAVLHRLSISTFLMLAWMVIVSAGCRYDPEGLGGLGAEGHCKRGGRSLRGIDRPPIPPAISHIITELVSADRRYHCYLFIMFLTL